MIRPQPPACKSPACTPPACKRTSGRASLPAGSGRLADDRRGIATIEFALVAPVFLGLIIAIFDIGQLAYGKAVLAGAVQNAARSAALETADTARADNMVRAAIAPVLPGVEIVSSRVSYFDFADIGRAERWNDADGNGECDNDETYTDENGSGEWEADVGLTGNGGAGDVVVYSVDARYETVFHVPFAPESWRERTISATMVRKNQPFADQREYSSTSGVCS